MFLLPLAPRAQTAHGAWLLKQGLVMGRSGRGGGGSEEVRGKEHWVLKQTSFSSRLPWGFLKCPCGRVSPLCCKLLRRTQGKMLHFCVTTNYPTPCLWHPWVPPEELGSWLTPGYVLVLLAFALRPPHPPPTQSPCHATNPSHLSHEWAKECQVLSWKHFRQIEIIFSWSASSFDGPCPGPCPLGSQRERTQTNQTWWTLERLPTTPN